MTPALRVANVVAIAVAAMALLGALALVCATNVRALVGPRDGDA